MRRPQHDDRETQESDGETENVERDRAPALRLDPVVWSSAKATLAAENFPTTYMTTAHATRDAAHQAFFEFYRLV